jgi:hypothetical protein
MMSDGQGRNVSDVRVPALERIATRGQVWARVSEKYGVANPVPPWKSSLDGMCDALDRNGEVLPLLERRRDEDLLSQAVYPDLPAPESQLVGLAHSLVARGLIDEQALARRMQAVRTRLQATSCLAPRRWC